MPSSSVVKLEAVRAMNTIATTDEDLGCFGHHQEVVIYNETPQQFYNKSYHQITNFGTGSGTAVINTGVQSGLMLECPMMIGPTACFNKQEEWLLGDILDESRYDNYEIQVLNTNNSSVLTVIEKYVNIGTDFNLYFFLGCPEVYYNADLGTPVTA